MRSRRLCTIPAAIAAVAAVALTNSPTSAATPTASSSWTPAVVTPTLTVLKHTGRVAAGYLFTGPKIETAAPAGAPIGPLISDNQGRSVWFRALPAGVSATDVRVQRYRGKPVLTYWEGSSHNGAGHGEGTDYILNRHYRTIAKVNAGHGLEADQHEFVLTRRNTALITVYRQTTVDATSVGGPKKQAVLEGVVQEINVRTGKVIFSWHSLKHVPLSASHLPLPAAAGTAWDYFHINAVRPDTDGNLIVSARHTWTVYKINRKTGHVIWQLGGKSSSFKLGHGVRFAWQHDPKPQGKGIYRIFDNASNGVAVRAETRIITVKVNTKTHRAKLVESLTHPDGLSAPSQGDSQLLPNGNLLVGWGALGRVSEFNRKGKLIFDATVPSGYDTYRAYRSPWVGLPLTRPSVQAAKASGDDSHLDLVWNGATRVATWQLRGGSTKSHLRAYRAVAWDGLDTTMTVSDAPTYVRAVALDKQGHVLGRSPVVATS